MNEKQAQLDWKFGLIWLVVCAVGFAVGGLLAFFSMWSVADAVAEVAGDSIGGAAGGLLFGFLIALGANIGPGLLLGRKGLNAGRWIIYSCAAGALGVGIAFALAFSFVDTMSEAASAVFMALTLGLPIGIGQWLALNRDGVRANVWPLISLAAYSLAAIVIAMGPENNPLTLPLAGFLVGSVTAMGMVMLGRRMAVAELAG